MIEQLPLMFCEYCKRKYYESKHTVVFGEKKWCNYRCLAKWAARNMDLYELRVLMNDLELIEMDKEKMEDEEDE